MTYPTAVWLSFEFSNECILGLEDISSGDLIHPASLR